jgi:elongation factor P
MIPVTQIRRGMVILFEGDPCRVMDFHHVTPGNLRGFVQVKMRNLKSGNSFEHRFGADEKVERTTLDLPEPE